MDRSKISKQEKCFLTRPHSADQIIKTFNGLDSEKLYTTRIRFLVRDFDDEWCKQLEAIVTFINKNAKIFQNLNCVSIVCSKKCVFRPEIEQERFQHLDRLSDELTFTETANKEGIDSNSVQLFFPGSDVKKLETWELRYNEDKREDVTFLQEELVSQVELKVKNSGSNSYSSSGKSTNRANNWISHKALVI